MINQLNEALKDYQTKWRRLVAGRRNKDFFEELQPTAVAWKVAERTEHNQLVAELQDKCKLVIDSWMDGRWIAKLVLREDTRLEWGIQVIKIMERRPGSTDLAGLDHVDFYSPAVEQADTFLKEEPELDWRHETNFAHWISVRWEGTEAKLRTDTVLDSYIRELRLTRNTILQKALES